MKNEVQNLTRLNEFVLEISTQLILLDIRNFETGFQEILQKTVEFIELDSALILQKRDNLQPIQISSYYIADTQIEFLKEINTFTNHVNRWYKNIETHSQSFEEHIDIPIPGSNNNANVNLLVFALPIVSNDSVWGHICFFSHLHKIDFFQKKTVLLNLLKFKFEDILLQRNKNENLFENEGFLNSYLNNLLTPFMVVNKKFEVIRYNEAMNKIVNAFFDRELTIGTIAYDYGKTAEDREYIKKCIEKTLVGEKVKAEVSIKNKENTIYWFEISYNPILDSNLEVIYVGIECLNITEKKRTEQNLLENREITKKIFKITPDHLYIYDIWRDFNIFDNKGMGKLLGMDGDVAKKLTSKDIRELMHPEDRHKQLAMIEELKNTTENKTFHLEYRILHTDGAYRHLYDRINIFKTREDGRIWFILGAVSDISDRKKAEQDLNESQKNLKSILENSIQGFFLVSRDYKIVVFNDLAKKMIAKIWNKTLKNEDVIQKYSIYNSVPKFENLFIACFTGKTIRLEKEIQYTEDEFIWLEIHLSPIFNEDKTVGAVLYSLLDITERKIAEENIKESQILYRTVAENYPNGAVSIFDKSLRLIFTAGNIYKELKLNYEKMIRKSLYQLFGTYPEIIKQVEKYYLKTFEGESTEFEIIFNNRFFVINTLPLMEKDGKINSIISFSQDITERKESELRLETLSMDLIVQNQELLIKEQDLAIANEILIEQKDELNKVLEELSDRNFELDQIIYKTSHDIRSPLASVLGLINLIKIEKDIDRQENYVEYIEKSILKLDRFTKSMLDYAKNNRTGLQITEINFEEIIGQCLNDLQYLKNYDKVRIITEIKNTKQIFRSDLFRLNIVFSNIISNAIKYVNLRAEDSYLKILVEIGQQAAIIRFEDNGIGIAQEYIDKIFDMFFRATDSADGSGLGLYIVKQTIERLHGNVKLTSNLNKGSEFYIELPNLSEAD